MGYTPNPFAGIAACFIGETRCYLDSRGFNHMHRLIEQLWRTSADTKQRSHALFTALPRK